MAKITGLEAHLKRLQGMSPERVGSAVGKALEATASAVAADAQISLTTNASSGQQGGKHQHIPSLPGQPPNQEFGTLGNSIEAVLVEPLKAEVSANAPYAAALEYGTSKIAERPFMRPALEKNRGLLKENLSAAVDALLAGKS